MPVRLEALQESEILTTTGVRIKLGDTLTTASLVDFYFVGCPPCESKMKSLHSIADESNNPQYRSILICDGRLTDYQKFLSHGLGIRNERFVLLYDSAGILSSKLGLQSYPFEISVVDQQITGTLEGYDSESSALYEKETLRKFSRK
ncbi:MAG: hypothetical protein EOO09_11835 [Chitinophagaceae bacterium]|nr:MAG: hypothetical protein EOO09_11835 [Chitinophagaceae bacterium]